MIITCPNCQTKYQVADHAIGSAGRKVQCAHCHQSWRATAPLPEPDRSGKPRIVAGTDIDLTRFAPHEPNSDRLFSAENEATLDEAFAEEEDRGRPEPAGPDLPPDPNLLEDDQEQLDHRLISRRLREMARRQQKHAARLPLARIRRMARMTALIMLMTLCGMVYQFRVDIVRAFPDLGGLYATLGLPVNIYGLTFSEVETLRTLKDGDDVTIISAKIRSVIDHTVRVPPVLVSILNSEGAPIYEWTARAPVDNISPGDVVAFETQLTSAPVDAAHVRLVFGSSSASEDGTLAADALSGGP